MWLATLDENRVRADKRDELTAYQAEAAISPRATEHQLNAAIFQARAQMELCQAAQGLIHPDHLEAKARVILARGMGPLGRSRLRVWEIRELSTPFASIVNAKALVKD